MHSGFGHRKECRYSIRNSNGTFTIPYTLNIRNYAPSGNSQYDLLNLRLSDDLAAAFSGATINSVTNIQSPTLSVNPNFNGSTDQSILSGTDRLPAGTTATVTFSVTVTPGSGPNGFGPFNNTTIANATSQGGTPVSDRSNNGTNPDPDNDGNPGNNSDPTPVSLPTGSGSNAPPTLRLVKRVTNVIRAGPPLNTINFNTFVDGPGEDDNAPGWAQLPQGAPVGVFNIGTNPSLQSGDEVEYTIYYLLEGSTPVNAINLCDAVPSGTQLVANSIQVKRGTASATSSGGYFPPLAPLPTGNPCNDQSNLNGTVLFDVGDVSPTPKENVGFVRFRVRID